ncbi:sialic acid binding Ig-like lectin 15, like [Archocentrus centrarchus]|uniref:sialic acid binding Ig-like lectin 15, like n=1 Tax=Archocentrus centrarchus TaxID=63155 RepID=UPI0011EA405A|nr:sialic acid-binding Ig-like lectin 15 [Archocentrus centrarchus]
MWQQCLSLILCAIVSGSVSAGWKLTVSPVVTVSRGEDAVLGCVFTPKQQDYSGMITVKWRTSHAPPFFECSVKNESTEGDKLCASADLKYSLKGDPRQGNASLLIRKVQLTDNRVYFCRVELDGRWGVKEAKTELYVEGEPQILNLSVVEMPCGSNSAPQRLQCEVEGNPLPKIVWLSASAYMLENQGEASESGPYHVTSCVPYLEEDKEITCRAENSLTYAASTYPTSDLHDQSHPPKILLIVCGVIAILVVIAGVVLFCLMEKRPQQVSDGPAEGEELQMVYSEAAMPSSTSLENHHRSASAAAGEELQAVYSEVTMPASISCALYSTLQ